jgi:uncharacterized protein YyaL (SSP411 family)
MDMTPARIEELARQAGLLHGPADDRARLMLAALSIFAEAVRAEALEEAAKLCDERFEKRWYYDKHGAGGIADCADAIRDLAEKGAKC